MQHNSDVNKKAWNIRRNAAKRFNCPVMDVSWGECLQQAKECCLSYLDHITRAYTASTSFEDLLTINERYNPTLMTRAYPALLPLANAFDKAMLAFNKPNRIYRADDGGFPPEMNKRLLQETIDRREKRNKEKLEKHIARINRIMAKSRTTKDGIRIK